MNLGISMPLQLSSGRQTLWTPIVPRLNTLATANSCTQPLLLFCSDGGHATDAEACVCEGICCLQAYTCRSLLLAVMQCASLQPQPLQSWLVATQDRRLAPNRRCQDRLARCYWRPGSTAPDVLCYHHPMQSTAW